MRLKPVRVVLATVLLVLWHLFLAWLARQAMPGTTSRWAVLPYVGVSLVYLAGVGWVARHLSSDDAGDRPNRIQALSALLLAQVVVQALDWLSMSPPGDLSLTLLGLPLVGLSPFIMTLQMLLPHGVGLILDRLVTVFVPWAVTYWAPGSEDEEAPVKKRTRRAAR